MDSERQVALGVEIGNVQTTVALINRQGKMIHRMAVRTLRGRPAVVTLEPYLRTIDQVFAQARSADLKVLGIGISIPGSIEGESRRLLQVPGLPSLARFPLATLLEERYHVPAIVHSDVDAAILGEHTFGVGRTYHRLLYLTVDAVVGASFAVDGRLESTPCQQYIGHICHIPISSSGPRCSCGRLGCINTLMSMDAMQKQIQRVLLRGEETSLIHRFAQQQNFSYQVLVEEVARGDSVAVRIYRQVGRWLGAALRKYMSIFEPNVFILGGGIARAGDLLFSQIRSSFLTYPSTLPQQADVLPAALGVDGSLIGSVVPLFV